MMTKPDLSRYRQCPGCRTWQADLDPCPKCGTWACESYADGRTERPSYRLTGRTLDDETYVQRVLDLIKDGDWHPKCEIWQVTGIYNRSGPRRTVVWKLLQGRVEVKTVTPRPRTGHYILIRIKKREENGKN